MIVKLFEMQVLNIQFLKSVFIIAIVIFGQW